MKRLIVDITIDDNTFNIQVNPDDPKDPMEIRYKNQTFEVAPDSSVTMLFSIVKVLEQLQTCKRRLKKSKPNPFQGVVVPDSLPENPL